MDELQILSLVALALMIFLMIIFCCLLYFIWESSRQRKAMEGYLARKGVDPNDLTMDSTTADLVAPSVFGEVMSMIKSGRKKTQRR